MRGVVVIPHTSILESNGKRLALHQTMTMQNTKETTMTRTRGFTRDELVDMALYYVKAGGRDATDDTAMQLIDAARDSMLGREDVPELREEDGDREIVIGAIRQFVAQAIEEEW